MKTICRKRVSPTCILGGPGIGKTTIATACLHAPRVAKKYDENRFFVRCDACTGADSLRTSLAESLGVTIGPDLEPRIFSFLRQIKPALLLLDNLDSPWEQETVAVEELVQRLTGVPELALISTVRGTERPGMVDWNDPIKLEPVALEAAREIFCTIAGSHFHDDPDLDALLNEVDLLPLAVNLLAHRSEGLASLQTIRLLWDRSRDRLLQRGTADDRVTNLGLSVELSIAGPRLDPESRDILYAIAMLPDGMSHADAIHVFGTDGPGSVATLIKVGLMISDVAGRTRFLAPIREYISSTHPPIKKHRETILMHYASIAAEQGPKVGTVDGREATRRITEEYANIEFTIREGLNSSNG